jgi:hypothetical protein
MRFFSLDTRAVPVVRLSLLSASLVSLLSLSTLFTNPSLVQAQETVPDAPPAAVSPEADAPMSEDSDDAPPADALPETDQQTDAASADAAPADTPPEDTGEDATSTLATDEAVADAVQALETLATELAAPDAGTEDESPSDASSPEATPTPAAAGSSGATTQTADKQQARIFADSVRYEGGLIIAESADGKGVRLEGEDAQGQPVRVWADKIIVDTVARTLRAQGNARVERTRQVQRRTLDTSPLLSGRRPETVTETLRGADFQYNFQTQQGSLDNVQLQLAGLDVSAASLSINGRSYTARNVLLRPGGLTEEEVRIYGTPPFNIRARSATFDAGLSRPTSAISNGNTDVSTGPGAVGPPGTDGRETRNADPAAPRITVRGGALYFRNTRLFPIPSYVFRRINIGPREEQAYTLTPRISFSSVDGVLVTTQLVYPLSQQPDGLTLNADVGHFGAHRFAWWSVIGAADALWQV